MANFYFKPSKKEELHSVPSRNTIDFLLNYSKSLKIIEYNHLHFEMILN